MTVLTHNQKARLQYVLQDQYERSLGHYTGISYNTYNLGKNDVTISCIISWVEGTEVKQYFSKYWN